MISQAHFWGAVSSSPTAVCLLEEMRLLFLRMESLCILTSSSFISYTSYTLTERLSPRGRSSSITGRTGSTTAANIGVFSSSMSVAFSTLIAALVGGGRRTERSSLMLISRIFFAFLETLLYCDFASSSFFSLNMLTRERSSALAGSSSFSSSFSSFFSSFLSSFSLLFLMMGCSVDDLVDSVLTRFSTGLGGGSSIFSCLGSQSLCLRERAADLESAVSMAFSGSEVLLMDCFGVSTLLRDELELAELSSCCWLRMSCSFLRSCSSRRLSSSSLRRRISIISRSCASAIFF